MSDKEYALLRSGRSLSKIIKEGRKAKKMTQQDLAEAVGMSREWVSTIEKDADRAQAMSFALTNRILLTIGVRMAAVPIDAPKLIEQIERANEKSQAKGLEVVSTVKPGHGQ